jgi:hypothetical protein
VRIGRGSPGPPLRPRMQWSRCFRPVRVSMPCAACALETASGINSVANARALKISAVQAAGSSSMKF